MPTGTKSEIDMAAWFAAEESAESREAARRMILSESAVQISTTFWD